MPEDDIVIFENLNSHVSENTDNNRCYMDDRTGDADGERITISRTLKTSRLSIHGLVNVYVSEG